MKAFVRAIAMMSFLAASCVIAQAPTAEGNDTGAADASRRGERGRPRAERARFNPDANKDGIVDAEEAEAAAEQALERAQVQLDRIKQRYDDDGDGTLSEAEQENLLNTLKERGRAMSRILSRIDTDGDWTISEAEGEAFQESMIAQFEQRNERMLTRFDEDGDGTLSDAEQEKARQTLRDMRERRQRQQGDENGPDRRGNRRRGNKEAAE